MISQPEYLGCASMSPFYRQLLRILLMLLWIMWKTAGWLFKFLDPAEKIPLTPEKQGDRMLFKHRGHTGLNKPSIEKQREDPEILMRLDRLTKESNTLLKILVGLRPPKEEGNDDTDVSEEDISEDESQLKLLNIGRRHRNSTATSNWNDHPELIGINNLTQSALARRRSSCLPRLGSHH